MAMDAIENFASSVVTVAPSPADTGTTMTVDSSPDSFDNFPDDPAFTVLVRPQGEVATLENSEILRVGLTGSSPFNAWTIARQTDDGFTTFGNARMIEVGDVVEQVVTANLLRQAGLGATLTSGDILTHAMVSGTGYQNPLPGPAIALVPITFTPTGSLTATVAMAISPDNSTFTTVISDTMPANVALAGIVRTYCVGIPLGWFLKVTVNAQAAVGTAKFT